MKVGVFHTETSKNVADALMVGIAKCGHEAILTPPSIDDMNVIAFYGMSPEHSALFNIMKSKNKPTVIVDAPYFDRKPKAQGHLKVSVNGLHPHKYFQKFRHSDDRFKVLGVGVRPMRRGGDFIVLAGIGPKSSNYYGIKHQSWDIQAVATIRSHTDKPIIYRVKPNHVHTFKKIPRTTWSDTNRPLVKVLNGAWAVVTHHSNVAVDGIVKGIPCFAQDGVGTAIGLSDLNMINKPKIVSFEEQMQFLYDLAYTQWTLEEMASGQCWKHLESEGLLQ